MGEFTKVGVFFIIALIFPLLALLPSWKLQPRQPGGQKRVPYECGVDTVGRSWVQFKTSYFLYALAFVAFDVETVFLYPWAVVFRSMDISAFIAMFVFMAILLLGLWYAWRKGALEWK